ncbi:hypothetical protein [Rhodoferax saidenbachensis]|uniref:Uncharacterized protein n=1 Tax=Rhodoferax saidenbachensis TaxID=1484693 RepID=A0ABU1ZTV0_9BURK|nr:hypothetical protein [Rhodoferax saidenbachensis]MDR7307951.1 hypothetical protein [Rhodoferax saidenbachensis]
MLNVANLHPAGMVLSSMATAIQGIYNMGTSVNEFIDDHIDLMKKSENSTVSKTGRVLEMAKFGFGLGYMSSVTIIATGQLLLGNTLAAAGTVATAVTLTNPIAMTCAAFGAIYYGWNALSDAERNELLDKLRAGLEIGVETIKAIIAFVVKTTNEILSPENIAEFKGFIKTYAAKFGRSLSDVTGRMVDILKDAAEQTVKKSSEIYESTAGVLSEVATQTGQVASSAAEATSSAAKSALESTGAMLGTTSMAVKGAVGKASEAASETAKGLYVRTVDAAQQLKTSKAKPGLLAVDTSKAVADEEVAKDIHPPKV